MTRILFAGYAPVHYLCFRPVHHILGRLEEIDVWCSGGFRRKEKGAEPSYELDGFYEPHGVDPARVIPVEEAREEPFDVVVCAHSSDVFFPRDVGRRVQIFHGVSFKNFAVREKVLKYDFACVAGRYHAERFAAAGLIREGGTRFLLTGFPKLDVLADGTLDRDGLLAGLDLDPGRPTVLYAPTGGKHNSLDKWGEEIVSAVGADGSCNLLIKPHDHPKKAIDWKARLAPFEGARVRIVEDYDVVPFLNACDLLLTDASSVAMEYTLLDRPIVFVDVPELFANVTERGGSLDLDTYGRKIGWVAEGVDAVVPTIAQALADPGYQAELRRRAADHLFHMPGAAADNVAAVILHAAGLRPDLPEAIEPILPTGDYRW